MSYASAMQYGHSQERSMKFSGYLFGLFKNEYEIIVVLVAKKRLRRTENVRGIFEGVSAPRECGQPSPLPAHRNP